VRRRVSNLVALVLVAATTNGRAEDQITQQLNSTDPSQIQQAVAAISERIHVLNPHDRRIALLGLTREAHWLKKLMNAERYQDVVHLTVEATVLLPSDVSLVEYLQSYRVQALLKLGRPQEALAAAKGQFNVCRMRSTADNLLLLVDCLKAAHPGEEAIIERFRQEQMAGAELSKSSAGGSQPSVLAGIKINGTPYAAAIQQSTMATNHESLTSLGNLLLLSDRPKEARAAFERAYAAASDKD
jgi:hypothetical protein